MTLLRRAAKLTSGALGRSSAVVNALRPTYDHLLELSTGGNGIVQTLNGHERFRIDPQYRVHFPETYDPEVCDVLRTRVRPGAISLDLGAHVGIYALCLAEWSAPSGRVFAFEPNPNARAVLERHVALNNFTQRIEVVPQAVSNAQGETTFFASGLEGFSRLDHANPDIPEAKASPIKVPVTSVDAFCGERNMIPDWIVMDIEGYEVAALAGARNTIHAARGRMGLIVEMHPTLWTLAGTSRVDFGTLIDEFSLKVIPLSGQTDPFTEYGIVSLEYL